MDELYRDHILDHYKHPRNFGELEPHDAAFHDNNPLCGDELGVQLRIADDRLEDLRFHGQGCAISQAAASMLSEEVKGMPLQEVRALDKQFVLELLGIDISPTRLKCALLGLKVLKAAAVGMPEWPADERELEDAPVKLSPGEL